MNGDAKTVLIIGAGPAGLTAAFELLGGHGGGQGAYKPIVFEADSQAGGISRTVNYKGNRIDIGGHRFFSKSDWVMDWWQNVLPLEQSVQGTAVDIRYQNRRHAFQARHGAPVDPDAVMLVRTRLSRIFFNRRFFKYPISLSFETLANLGPARTVRIGLSYLRAMLFPRPEKSLEDFLINRFGRELYLTFFKSYTEKVWGVACTDISPEWGAQRIKGLSIGKALLHMLKKPFLGESIEAQKGEQTSLIERFLYPKHGPGQMWEQVAERVQERGGEIHYRHRVVGLEVKDGTIGALRVLDEDTGEIRRVPGDYVISSMPIKDLVAGLDPPAPANVREIAVNLPYRDFIIVGVLVSGMRPHAGTSTGTHSHMPPDNWIYVQESDVLVGRLQVFNNWSPAMVADQDHVWLGLEYFCSEGDALWGRSDEDLKQLAVSELAKLGLADEKDCLDAVVIRMPKAYPAYFGSYARFSEVRAYLDQIDNLYLIGRNGMHRYNNQDHSMLTAREAVASIVEGRTDKTALWSVNTEQDYHEERSREAV